MSSESAEPLDAVVLRFFVAPGGALRCRATDLYTRRTWIVRSANALRELLAEASVASDEKVRHDA